MIVIDGSHGEGGGQVLRSSLALSAVTGKPFRIENIRAKRKAPGLLRQHLTAVQAAARICGAAASGMELNSSELTFVPGKVEPGDYQFAIGSAGSTMLVLQTILLPLVLASGPSVVEIEGGTHNPNAPPFDFMDQAFLPVLRRIGARVELELVRPGFYPAGGGKIRVSIEPSKTLERLELLERGAIVERRVRAVVANLPYSIAEREVRTAGEVLDWGAEVLQAHTLTGSLGPGNAISITVASEHVTDVFTGFGMRGVSAEKVAHDAAKAAKRYINSGAAAGEHLADQLLLPMALGRGGSFTTTPLSGHTTTNVEIIRQFIDAAVETEQISNGVVRVRVDV